MPRAASAYTPRSRRGRHRSDREPCRDCKAPMLWATAGAGNRIPLDEGIADVTRSVYVLLSAAGGWHLALEVRVGDGLELAGEAQEHGLDVRTSHFDTCPARLERMRPRERADLA